MIDIRALRDNPDRFIKGAAAKRIEADIPAVLELDRRVQDARPQVPGIHGGREVSGIRVVFEKGRVVKATAEKNQEYLLKMLGSDEGAKRLGETSYPDELLDPETNVRLGVTYLGGLLRRFRGQEGLAAAAYNAGARATMRWCDLWGGRPLDEFMELCSYTQTREYMKKVLEIYARYLYLYERQDWLPSETIDAAWLDDGIDY